jgi:hypothetical protein
VHAADPRSFFSFVENDHIEGTLSAERRQLMRDVFDLPDLAAMDDGIANGTYIAASGRRAAAFPVYGATGGLLTASPSPLYRHGA